jgi:hypothetical protein
MKIKVVASELVDSDIEMVSLVRHGANRCAFKILKTDEEPSIKDRIGNFLNLNSEDAAITAFFIKNDALERVLPIFKAAGFKGTPDQFEGVSILKVSNSDTKAVFQLSESVAVGINQPVKSVADEGIVKAHAVVIGADGFYPGVHLSTTTLDSIVWNLLNSNDENLQTDRLEKTEAMLASFRKYVGSLLQVLPKEIFKIEGALRDLDKDKDTGTDSMKVAKLTEVASGDLEGIELSGDVKKAAAADVTPAPVVETPPVIEVAKEAADPCAGMTDEEKTAYKKKQAEDEEEEEVDFGKSVIKALEAVNSTLKGLQETVTKTQEETKTLADRMGTVEELAKATSIKAGKPVVVVNKSEDSDLALDALGGARTRGQSKVRFSKDGIVRDSLWDGLFEELETFRPSS